MFSSSNMILNRKEREYKSNLHELMVKDDDEMRERANRMTVGNFIAVHGFLKIQQVRNENGKHRGRYLVLPRRLIACQLPSQTAAN